MEERGSGPHMSQIVESNIQALVSRRKHEERSKSTGEKIADSITKFTGSMLFVILHVILFGLWITWNARLLGLPVFDPSFVVLAMFASVEAIFLSTFVLITQNRMNEEAEKGAELDLQISLLTEHEVTRLITLVTGIAKKLDIQNLNDAEIQELEKDVHPEHVLDTIEKVKKESEF